MNEDKSKLIEELVQTKSENQKNFFDLQSKEQTILSLQDTQMRFQAEADDKRKLFDKLTRKKFCLEGKVKQLMAYSSANALKVETDDSDEQSEYEVDDILKHTTKKGKLHFLIRWKNYSPSHDSWQIESDLHCPQILNEYLKKKGLKMFEQK